MHRVFFLFRIVSSKLCFGRFGRLFGKLPVLCGEFVCKRLCFLFSKFSCYPCYSFLLSLTNKAELNCFPIY